MQISIADNFNQRGIYHVAPNFHDDFEFYTTHNLWNNVNCLGWALGYRGDFFSREVEGPANTLEQLSYLLSHYSILPLKDNNLAATPEGHYPIAGFISPDECSPEDVEDYHLYRMDCNGKWSHKSGREIFPANQFDKVGNEIYNPLLADKHSLTGNYNYTGFIGFYAVPSNSSEISLPTEEKFKSIKNHAKESLGGKLLHGVIQLTV